MLGTTFFEACLKLKKHLNENLKGGYQSKAREVYPELIKYILEQLYMKNILQ